MADTRDDLPLPHNLEAERSVLGVLALYADRLVEVADTLRSADFFRHAHRLIFDAMLRIAGEQGSGFDIITLKDALARTGHLEAAGGPAYLASLCTGVPRATNLPYYASIVRADAHRRRIIEACTRATKAAYERELDIEALIEQTESDILGVGREMTGGDFVMPDEWVPETVAYIEKLASAPRHVTGVATGFREIDHMTRGFQPGDLIVLGARPSMGKTALSLQIGAHASQAETVGVFSVEMARAALSVRAFASTGRISAMRLMTGKLRGEDYARFTHTMDTLRLSKLAIDDSAVLTPLQLRTKARRLKARHGLSLLIVDYLQILEATGSGKRRADTRALELGQITRALKQLAKELHVPILLLSQVTREPDRRSGDTRPKMSDLRDSGAIEADADVILMLHRPEYYQDQPKPDDLGKAEVIVAKQRNGPTGIVNLKFTKDQMRFDDYPEAA